MIVVDWIAGKLAADFQIGEEAGRIFVEMKKAIRFAVKAAPLLFGQAGEFSDFLKDRLERIESFFLRVSHGINRQISGFLLFHLEQASEAAVTTRARHSSIT
ncbi:MAG TPA: hypothetical protein VIX12_09290 [Candidatus Binataceae bacterium]